MPRLFKRVWVEELVERFVLRRADLSVAASEDNRQFIVDQGVPREKTRIFRISNVLAGVHYTDPATRTGGEAELAALGAGGAEVLLVISRLEALKFTDHAVRALAELKDRRPLAKLVYSGDGSQRGEIEALARDAGIEDRVIFAGNRDQNWLARVLPHVSVVVSPLTGRALAEAALGAAPIVAYDVDWHSEVVRDGETGLLVPHQDYRVLADSIARLLEEPAYARKLGAAVRRHVLEMMDPQAADREQMQAYRELLGEDAVRP
jgi:glycosyltransferase involved in cell wall biosynthesis